MTDEDTYDHADDADICSSCGERLDDCRELQER
jgi:hypothetical protein